MLQLNEYIQRRKNLREKMDSGLILFLGNQDSSMNYKANTYAFQQDRSFLYYFGINDPSLAAIIDLDSGQEIVFGDDLTVHDLVFTGQVPTIAERAQGCGIKQTANLAKLAEVLKDAVNKKRAIHLSTSVPAGKSNCSSGAIRNSDGSGQQPNIGPPN